MFWDERNRRVIRIGDTTTHGGKVLTGESRMMIMGKPVARIGDIVWCPKCLSANYIIVQGHEQIQTFGRKVAFEGDRTSCGAMLVSSLETGQSNYSKGLGYQNSSAAGNNSSTPNTNTRTSNKSKAYGVQFLLVDSKGRALFNMPYKVLHGSQTYATGTTDGMGRTQTIQSDASINLHVQIDAQQVRRKKFLWG